MVCDIIFHFGNSNFKVIFTSKDDINQDRDSLVIKIPEESQGPTTLDEIVQELAGLSKVDKTRLLNKLNSSSPGIDFKKLLKDGVTQVVSNCSFEQLKEVYPIVGEFLKEEQLQGYNINLVTGVKNYGEWISGRIFMDGIEFYNIGSEDEARRFAKGEAAKAEVRKLIDENTINVDGDNGVRLKEKHSAKLQAVLEYARNNDEIKERIKAELGSDVTLQSVLIDFLNYKQKYTDKINYKNSALAIGVTLQDFINDLVDLNNIMYSDTESTLAAALRSIDRDRKSFGKRSLYDVLVAADPEFASAISEEAFASLDAATLRPILEKFFDGDPILEHFEITKCVPTAKAEESVSLTKIKALFKENIKRLNNTRPEGSKIEAGYDDLVKTLEDAQRYIGSSITLDGKTYPLKAKISDGKIKYFIYRNKLSDSKDQRIEIDFKGLHLDELLGITEAGFATQEVLLPVTEEAGISDRVVDGKYQGYYIYKTTRNGKETYLITKSPVYPELYINGVYTQLREAKQQIKLRNSRAHPYTSTNAAIKEINFDPARGPINTPTSIGLRFDTTVGQVIDSIDYYLPANSEYKLRYDEKILYYEGNLAKVKEFYLNNFDFSKETKEKIESVLDTPEKAGIFILEMVNKGILLKETKTRPENYDEIAKNTLTLIEQSPTVQYIVRRSFRNDDTKKYTAGEKPVYTTFLQKVITPINSSGTTDVKTTPKQSLTASLHHMCKVFNEQLFKDTGIEIVLTDEENLAHSPEFFVDGKSIFGEDVNFKLIHGFVYNNKIYINQSSISGTDNALYHEIMHITLGAIKVNDAKNGTHDYEELVEKARSKAETQKTNIRATVERAYPNLAKPDKDEEIAVRYFARQMENAQAMYLSEEGSEEFDTKVMENFLNLFTKFRKNMSEALNKTLATNSVGFTTGYRTLFSEGTLSKMEKNRIAANLIERGIANETIREHDCL